jgi:zinc/manganese transport system permease protein
VAQGFSPDLLADLQLLLQLEFMRNALLVGTLVAALAGAVGWFVVLRGQSFAAHMLSQVGFPGAAGAVLVGASPVAGLLVFCVAAALWVASLGGSRDTGRRREAAAVGTILAFALGLGLLFFRLVGGSGSVETIYAFLFGTILGISRRDVLITLLTVLPALALLAAIARPLLFASVDPAVAEARGVPVRALSVFFLLLLAVATAVTVQVIGTLLIFALMVVPGATAMRLSSRPGRGLLLAVGLSLLLTWLGLATAYFTDWPVGFLITTLAFAAYLLARLAATLGPRWTPRRSAPAPPLPG